MNISVKESCSTFINYLKFYKKNKFRFETIHFFFFFLHKRVLKSNIGVPLLTEIDRYYEFKRDSWTHLVSTNLTCVKDSHRHSHKTYYNRKFTTWVFRLPEGVTWTRNKLGNSRTYLIIVYLFVLSLSFLKVGMKTSTLRRGRESDPKCGSQGDKENRNLSLT